MDEKLDCGLSMYFRNHRIRLRNKMIDLLQKPEYVHLRINEQNKQMFVQRCSRDKDAFKIYYSPENKVLDRRCYINAKYFLYYLAKVIGVDENSESLRFPGVLLDDNQTIFIDLANYLPCGDAESGDN